MKYEIVIGLETHVELNTKSKIFCSCGGHSSAKEANDCVCPACCGMPGMLPVMNKRVVELAATAGLMLNCNINKYSTFDKKNYYYPDLPCAYQITQLNHPICTNGHITIKTKDTEREIRIKQIHMEEDAGKLVHEGNFSYVDFNRTSVPLIEIVTQPDFRSADEVLTYLRKLKSMFQSSGISECETGAMRCDINISVRPEGSSEYGVRTEVKNMSSFELIEKAINYEAQRHIDAIEYETEELIQETRRFDEATGKTFAMRNKETEADYRYFPDPNLMPIVIDDAWLEKIKANKPIILDERENLYREVGIGEKEIAMLLSNHVLMKLLDDTVQAGADLKTASSWILTDLIGLLKRKNIALTADTIAPAKLARIIELVAKSVITRATGKKLLDVVVEKDVDPDEYRIANKLDMQQDSGLLENAVRKVLQENETMVAEYKAGKEKVFQALIGATMKELKGKAEPSAVVEALRKALLR